MTTAVSLTLAVLSVQLTFSHGDSIGTAANEFFLGFLQGYTPQELQPQLLVTTAEPGTVEYLVETASGNFSYAGEVTNGTVDVVTLPWWYQVEITETGVTNQGIHVKAEPDKQITVHGLLQPGAGDAYLAFPCTRIRDIEQYEYYAITYNAGTKPQGIPADYEGSTVLLVGCEDNTTVSIDNSVTVKLNRLETYLHYEVATRSDLTGAHYASNKPISVFSGHPCTFVPSSRTFCDPLIEQVPPTVTWGTSFLSKFFEGRTSGELYRVLAAHPSTEVTVSCNTMSTSLSLESAGCWKELQTAPDSYCSIESNRPILAMEFMLGEGGNILGDPFMMMLPPVDQYSNRYNLHIAPNFQESYLTVYVPPQSFQPRNIILNGDSLEDESWTAVNCSGGPSDKHCGYIASLEVSPGVYQLYHDHPSARIGVSVHGISPYASYGYIGGLMVQTECHKRFCQNGGMCSLLTGTSTCDCLPGYGGVLCEVVYPTVCHPPCENGGMCVANDSCSCPTEYTGDKCTEPVVQSCDVNPCQNGGNCTKYGKDYLCNCSDVYTGERCAEKESNSTESTNSIVIIIASLLVSLFIVGAIVSCAALIIRLAMKRHNKTSDSSGQCDQHVYENTIHYSNVGAIPSCTDSKSESIPPLELPTAAVDLTEHMYDYVQPDLDGGTGPEVISTQPNVAYGHLNC